MLNKIIAILLLLVSNGFAGRRAMVDVSSTIPYISEADQVLYGGVADGTDNDVNDLIGTLESAEYVDNACLTLSGSQYVLLGSGARIPATNDFRLIIDCTTWDRTIADQFIFGQNLTGDAGRFNVGVLGAGNLIRAYQGGSAILTYTYPTDFVPVTIEVSRVSGTFSLLIDGDLKDTYYSAVAISDTEAVVGRVSTTASFGYYRGKMSGLKIINGSTVADYSFAEGWDTTIYDRSGNDNHGTLTGATLATAWGQTQDEIASNQDGGFTLYTHATDESIRVPYGVDGNPLSITVPSGYTKMGDYPPGTLLPPVESSILQTDTNLLDRAVWSDDESSFLPRDYSYITNWIATSNGTDGVYFTQRGETVTTGTSYDTDWHDAISPSILNLLNTVYGDK